MKMHHRHLALNLLKFRSSDTDAIVRLSIIHEIRRIVGVCPNDLFKGTIPSDASDPNDDAEFLEAIRELANIHFSETSAPQVDKVADWGTALEIIRTVCEPVASSSRASQKRKLDGGRPSNGKARADAGSSSSAYTDLTVDEPSSAAAPVRAASSSSAADRDHLDVYRNADLISKFRIGHDQQDVHELFMAMPRPILDLCRMSRLRVAKEMEYSECGKLNPTVTVDPSVFQTEDVYLGHTAHDSGALRQKGLIQHSDRYVEAGDGKGARVRFETWHLVSFGPLFVLQFVIFDRDARKNPRLVTWGEVGGIHTLTDLQDNSRVLVAVICHKGHDVGSGHYVTMLHFTDRVVVADDSRVVDARGYKNDAYTPYMLFYARRRLASAEYTPQGLENIGNSCFVNSLMQALQLATRCM